MLRELFQSYQPVPGAGVLFAPERTVIGKCPRCGANVIEAQKGYLCENRSCRFALWKDSKFFQAKRIAFTADMATALLRDGKVKLIGCVSEKTGKRYDAIAMLRDDGTKATFELEFLRRAKK